MEDYNKPSDVIEYFLIGSNLRGGKNPPFWNVLLFKSWEMMSVTGDMKHFIIAHHNVLKYSNMWMSNPWMEVKMIRLNVDPFEYLLAPLKS